MELGEEIQVAPDSVLALHDMDEGERVSAWSILSDRSNHDRTDLWSEPVGHYLLIWPTFAAKTEKLIFIIIVCNP